jgi:hypothetical protein
VTEAEWLNERRDSFALLWSLRGTKVTRTKAGRRKLRLFACGCCRLIEDRLADERLRHAVEVAERFAEGQAGKEELAAAKAAAQPLAMGGYLPEAPGALGRNAAAMAVAAAHEQPFSAGIGVVTLPIPLAGYRAGQRDGRAVLCDLLRCVFGNPFRPVSLGPAWAARNDRTAVKLAQAIYDERALDRLAVLADALEDAGCADAELLGHLRGPGPHVRGCWAVDLLLGKG